MSMLAAFFLILPSFFGQSMIWNHSLRAQEAFYAKIINPADLLQVLKTDNFDMIQREFNNVKMAANPGEIMPIVLDLWYNKKEKYLDLRWDIINKDIVRLLIVDVIIQEKMNGAIEIEETDLHDFVYGLLFAEDRRVKRSAISVISHFDRVEDVDEILDLAKKVEKVTFRTSVIVMTGMCNLEAAKAVDELVNFLPDGDAREYVVDMRQREAEVRKQYDVCSRPKF